MMNRPLARRLLRLLRGGDRALRARVAGVDHIGGEVGPEAGSSDAVGGARSAARRSLAVGLCEFAVVARAPVRIAQDAAGMIDEAQRLFDVALPIAGFRVILADQPP